MKHSLLRVSIIASVGYVAIGAAARAAPSIPRLVSSDQKLAAFVEGADCQPAVRVRFQAKSEAEFDRATGKAARFIGNVTDLLKSQCPMLTRVSVKGLVGERILYSGVAEAATDWVVVELGSRSGSGILSAGTQGKQDEKKKFAAAAGFIAAPAIIDVAKTQGIECVGLDAKTKTCLARNHYAVNGSQIDVTAEYLLNKDGTIAKATYSPSISQGFLCTDPNKVRVEVSGGKLTEESRTGMKELLIERLRSAGSEFCAGFAGQLPAGLSTQSFGADGSSQAPAQTAAFSSAVLGLRIES